MSEVQTETKQVEKITRTIITATTINASVALVVDGKVDVKKLSPIVVNETGSIGRTRAERIVRKEHPEHKSASIIIESVVDTTATYSMDLDKFMELATKSE